MNQEIENKKFPTNEQIKDFFGWKNICDRKPPEDMKNCIFPFHHTHEIGEKGNATISNVRDIVFKYRCKCGFIPGENGFDLLQEVYVRVMQSPMENAWYKYGIFFMCKTCGTPYSSSIDVSHEQIIKGKNE